LKAGDENNAELTLENGSGDKEEFMINFQTEYEEGKEVEIFYSQEGDVWSSYGTTKV
jgi:hypothetical protein